MTTEARTLISPIAFDMGAVNTGIVTTQYLSSECGHLPCLHGETITITPGKDLTFGLKSRTARRHLTRVYKRRKMAKRLLWVILRKHFGIDAVLPSDRKYVKAFMDFVNGLLNRRGFTYYSEDLDISGIPDVDRLISLGFDFLDARINFENQIPELGKHSESLLQHPIFGKTYLKSPDAKARMGNCDISSDEYKFIIGTIQDIIKKQSADAGGHKPRTEYLDEISAIISASWQTILFPLSKVGLTPKSFANFVGHVSNLQLRCLRKYFNEEAWGKEGDQWNEAKLCEKFHRYVIGWHLSGDNDDTKVKRQNKTQILDYLAQNPGKVIKLWMELPAAVSIPPYEDQNDRHPPKCSALLLDTDVLNRDYENWRAWIPSMNTQDIIDGKQRHFLDGFEVSSFLPEKDKANIAKHEDAKLARQLQVIFDRSSSSDSISLRRILFDNDSSQSREQKETLTARLGTMTDSFLDCARRYFDECEVAAKGGWYQGIPNRLLRECGANPPHKQKVAHLVIGHLLGVSFDSQETDQLKEFLTKTRADRTHLINIGEACAKLKKANGVNFQTLYKTSNEKDWENLRSKVTNADKALKEHLVSLGKLQNNAKQDYDDPYIWSQLYDVLKGDVHGFSKTCRCCSEDNSFRSSYYCKDSQGNNVAHAKRIPNNTDEPFDGMVAKLADRLARESAVLKANEIETWCRDNPGIHLTIDVPVIVEENRFEFAMDMYDFKKGEEYSVKKDQKDKVGKALANWTTSWQEKEQRIRDAASGICPYCGKSITSQGQIDHILPRAESIKRYGTIFNSEPNLIYCHGACNGKKSDTRYGLEDLAPEYLNIIFGTTNIPKIESVILAKFAEIRRKNTKFASAFATMSAEDRNIVRHVMFLDRNCQAYRDLVAELRQTNKANVNGTQRWLVKNFGSHLRTELMKRGIDGEVRISATRSDAERASRIRTALAQDNPVFVKTENQSAYSHVLDATMALGIWAMDRAVLGSNEVISGNITEANWFEGLRPKNLAISNLQRKPIYRKTDQASQRIFKDTIYGDKFLSIVVPVGSNTLHVGFSPNNSVKFKESKASKVYSLLRPFLRRDKKTPPETFDDVLDLVTGSNKPFICPIDSELARTHLHKVATQSVDDQESFQADLLDGLHYYTTKTPVIPALFEGKDQSQREKQILFKTAATALDAIKCQCKLTVKLPWIESDKREDLDLKLPSMSSWERIILSSLFAERWGTKVIDNDPLYEQMAEQFFGNGNSSPARPKARNVFSLPISKPPSGACCRIRRRTPNGHVWQSLSVQCAYKGFASKGNDIDISDKSLVEIDSLNTKRVHFINGRSLGLNHEVVLMDEWRKLELLPEERETILSLFVAPGSSSRMAVRIRIVAEKAKSLLGLEGEILPGVSSTVKVPPSNWNVDNILKTFCPRQDKKTIPVTIHQITPEYMELEYMLKGLHLKKRYCEAQA